MGRERETLRAAAAAAAENEEEAVRREGMGMGFQEFTGRKTGSQCSCRSKAGRTSLFRGLRES